MRFNAGVSLVSAFVVVSVVALCGSVIAQIDRIAVYADSAASACYLNRSQSGLATVYVVHSSQAGASASQFALVQSEGFGGTWLGDNHAVPVGIGNTQDGVSFGYGTCRSGNVLLASVNYWLPGPPDSCSYVAVVPHQSASQGVVETVDCAESLLAADGGLLYANPTSSCDCETAQSAYAEIPTMSAPESLSPVFQQAAIEFQVPQGVLEATGYMETRWGPRATSPSVDYAYGIMGLRDSPLSQTLKEAAAITGQSRRSLIGDDVENIRGAAAVLSTYFDQDNPTRHSAGVPDPWAAVLSRYTGITSLDLKVGHQDAFRKLIEDNKDRRRPSRRSSQPAVCTGLQYSGVTNFVAAHSSKLKEANRPFDHNIDRIVIHVAEGSYWGSLSWWAENNGVIASAHYIVGMDGAVGQAVCEEHIAYHAGNSVYNARSVGVEHEGFVETGGWTDEQLEESANLVTDLADFYTIPLDRTHIMGHSEVPNATHTDPGDLWDWCAYMRRLNPNYVCANPPAPQEPRGDEERCFTKKEELPSGEDKVTGLRDDEVHQDHLRVFRDEFLTGSGSGEEVIDRYYEHSPDMVDIAVRRGIFGRSLSLLFTNSENLRRVAQGGDWVVPTEVAKEAADLLNVYAEETTGELGGRFAFMRDLASASGGRSFRETFDDLARFLESDKPLDRALKATVHPNPFNPSTRISFELIAPSAVSVEVYNARGERVSTPQPAIRLPEGKHSVNWDATHFASGVYFVVVRTREASSTAKMLLLK